ncbi:hypothetical protein J2T02_000869 [Chitinophaga terrae (ex Kim and Jung 2007)]|uniref:DUF4091 domain-containing protein n=1 Tax=Chitinophaga terrae (ex Kim and Jung 2007) TaxID=408074 RepID=UPI002783FE23|nr:DUF4091 domain-containing protein [Chitinophaga terrae (ex Kim and Jung 2007)]MDQ0105776.1 hypothetical protein [Chitinophaga terrae (ex Kim and Jung 2007)]
MQLGIASATDGGDNSLIVTYVDPLRKVLQSDVSFPSDSALASVARGETATLQFVVRSSSRLKNLTVSIVPPAFGNNKLTNSTVRYVGYVKVSSLAKNGSRDRLNPSNGMFPDVLLEQSSIDVPQNTSQPVWISVNIPVSAVPGLYKGQVVLDGQSGGTNVHEVRSFAIQVYPVQVKSTSLNVSLWPSIDKFGQLNDGQPVPNFTDQYWQLNKVMAAMMAKYRQTVVLIYPLPLTQYTLNNGKYTFDFTNFDKMIDIYRAAGALKRIEGGFLGGRWGPGGWDADYGFFFYMPQGNKFTERTAKMDNPDLVNFYSQFIPALVSHLKSRNLLSIYYQHIGDEPIPKNSPTYIAFSKFIKQLSPELKTIDAVQTTNVADNVDVVVPQLDDFGKNYNLYSKKIAAGKEVWFYTCWKPQGEYANRFIEQQALKTRYLHLINFKYNLKGYLHWAYNQWTNNPYGEASKVLSSNSETLPGGDSWIVYPKKGGFLASIRLEAMRDGIVDYELLKMLSAKNPQLSNTIVNRLVKDFDSYEMDIPTFRKNRVQLLAALSK